MVDAFRIEYQGQHSRWHELLSGQALRGMLLTDGKQQAVYLLVLKMKNQTQWPLIDWQSAE